MSGFNWVNRDVVLALHEVSLARFGGMAGIRDQGLLESALMRPQMLAHCEPATGPYQLAAAYAFGILRNHPFLDGNKRTAFLTAYVFLRDNGLRFAAEQTEIVLYMVAAGAGSLSEERLAAWFEKTSSQLVTAPAEA